MFETTARNPALLDALQEGEEGIHQVSAIAQALEEAAKTTRVSES
jgi:hypothetical protein